jgi:hypothetical protein
MAAFEINDEELSAQFAILLSPWLKIVGPKNLPKNRRVGK